MADEAEYAKQIPKADLPALPEGEDVVEYFFDEEFKVEDGPWKRDESPLISRWLDANEKPLALVIEASQRSQYFVPVIKSDDSVLAGTYLSALRNALRESARMLGIRAMRKVNDGEIESAWADLNAVRRLARLSCRGPRFLTDVSARPSKTLRRTIR